jgi:hypothetical protein
MKHSLRDWADASAAAECETGIGTVLKPIRSSVNLAVSGVPIYQPMSMPHAEEFQRDVASRYPLESVSVSLKGVGRFDQVRPFASR